MPYYDDEIITKFKKDFAAPVKYMFRPIDERNTVFFIDTGQKIKAGDITWVVKYHNGKTSTIWYFLSQLSARNYYEALIKKAR